MATKVAHYTVSTSFIGSLHGDGVEYHKGEVIDGDDPALKRWPEYFEPLVVRDHLVTRRVEQATAAPGEKRNVVRRAVRKAKATVKPREATAAEELAITEAVDAEAEAEKEPEPQGRPITTDSFRGR